MTLVVDASVVVAALVDGSGTGDWARSHIMETDLAAPQLLPYEVASALRRLQRGRHLSKDVAALAHADLARLTVELFPYAPAAARVWELRDNLTPYDASYVALAELLQADLVTLDRKLARASGIRCPVRTP